MRSDRDTGFLHYGDWSSITLTAFRLAFTTITPTTANSYCTTCLRALQSLTLVKWWTGSPLQIDGSLWAWREWNNEVFATTKTALGMWNGWTTCVTRGESKVGHSNRYNTGRIFHSFHLLRNINFSQVPGITFSFYEKQS